VGWNQNSRMSIAIRKGIYKSKNPFMGNRENIDPKKELKETNKIIRQHSLRMTYLFDDLAKKETRL